MRYLVLVVFAISLVRADSVSCAIPAPLVGSCSSQEMNGAPVSGAITVGIGGPGVYHPPSSEVAFGPFNGVIHFYKSYSFGANLNGPGSVTLNLSIPNASGQWAAYGYEFDENYGSSAPNGYFTVTDGAGLHTGFDLMVGAGEEGGGNILFSETGTGPLQIIFNQSSPLSTNSGAGLTMLLLSPEPASWPILSLGIAGLALLKKRHLRL
jgi:hypothetical protein